MIAEQLSLDEALRERQLAMLRVFANADEQYKADLMRAIGILARGGKSFTADDARSLAGDPPPGCSPNVAGAIFNAAAKAGLIEPVGLARSGRVIGHGNKVVLWRGRP